jgi:PE-PPE domain
MRSLTLAIVTAAAIAVAGPAPAPALTSATALFMSGTQNCLTTGKPCTALSTPSPAEMSGTLPALFAGDTLVGVGTPAQVWPLTGLTSLTLDQSLARGVKSLDNAIKSTAGDKVVFGISQSAVIIAMEKKKLLTDPKAPLPDELSFVVEGNPTRPNGGLMARFPGLSVPFVGITSIGAAPDTPYDTVDVARQYDFFADFPEYPLNLVADLNALMGFFYVHLNYAPANDLSSVPPENIRTVTNSLGGTTTYYLVPTPNLPLLQPLRYIGVPAFIVDALNTLLKPIVEAGYNRDRSQMGVATPARLLPPPSAIVADVKNEVKAIGSLLPSFAGSTAAPASVAVPNTTLAASTTPAATRRLQARTSTSAAGPSVVAAGGPADSPADPVDHGSGVDKPSPTRPQQRVVPVHLDHRSTAPANAEQGNAD